MATTYEDPPDCRARQEMRRLFEQYGGQARLAEASGLPQGTLSRLAHSGEPEMSTVRRLAAAGIPAQWWIDAPVESSGEDAA